jgi:hypothetical protein
MGRLATLAAGALALAGLGWWLHGPPPADPPPASDPWKPTGARPDVAAVPAPVWPVPSPADGAPPRSPTAPPPVPPAVLSAPPPIPAMSPPQPEPVAVPQVPPPRSAASTAAGLRALIAASDCVLVGGDVRTDSIRLNGIGAVDTVGHLRAAFEMLRQDRPSDGTGYLFTVAPLPRSAAYCGVLETVRPFGRAVGAVRRTLALLVQHAEPVLHTDAPFALAVTMAEVQGWLQIDYFSGADVQHLALTASGAGVANPGGAPVAGSLGQGGTAPSAGTALRLGGGAARKVYEARAGEPGTDLIVAIASTERMFAQLRPDTEPALAYVEALRSALQDRPATALSADAVRLVIEP